MATWVFRKVERITKGPGDPDAAYLWDLERADQTNVSIGSGCSYRTLRPLLVHFGVGNPEGLVGMRFESERSDAGSALDLFATIIRHGGDYRPPNNRAVQLRAAEQLSEGKIPEFPDVDGSTVARAFTEAFDGFTLRPEWFRAFSSRIAIMSAGRVTLSEGRMSDFRTTVRGTGAYLTLTVDEVMRRMHFGPYIRPFGFDVD